METWDYLSYWLATHGIPSEVEETVTGDYAEDPWAPRPNSEAVRVTLDLDGAGRLASLLAKGRRLAVEQEDL